jgi:hypothetical protein
MNRYAFSVLTAVLGLGAACGSQSDQHAPAVGEGGAAAVAGASGAHHGAGAGGARSGTAGEAGGGAEAAEGGAAGSAAAGPSDGGAAGLEQGMIVPVTPSVCSETVGWSGPLPLVNVSSNAVERLLSITADELDVVFLRGGTLYRAHRDAPLQTFGAATTVSVPLGYDPSAGAALNPDGKALVLVSDSGQTVAQLTRASRSVAFGTTADPTSFAAINQRALQTMEHFAAPVWAPDGKSFVLTGFTPKPAGGFPAGVQGLSVVYESAWAGDAWAAPNSISHDLFDGTTAARPLPSALSSDSRTLFYFDEATSKQVARFRDRPDAPLYTAVDLGLRAGAAPNATCDVIYYSSNGNVLFESE